MSNQKEIAICPNHSNPITPLIWTFAFNGSEYWCPACRGEFGMMSVKKVPATEGLKEMLKDLKKRTRKYLQAKAVFVCDSKLIKGRWVAREDIPASYFERAKKVIAEYENQEATA